MTQHDKYLETNREPWDGWTEIHQASPFYDVDSFLAGRSSLNDIERDAVEDVADKTLLHLQCHFGLDTLCWARLGAETTGVNSSARAIETARALASETGVAAEFLCADVTDLPPAWDDRFEIVFTSCGVLSWLPDLDARASTIARALRPGGSFHLVEFLPLTNMLDDDGRNLRYPYFHSPRPDRYEVEGSYAEPDADYHHYAFE